MLNSFLRPLALVLSMLALAPNASAQGPGACDTQRCFSRQSPELRQRVLDGETVVVAEKDPSSPFEVLYAFRRARGADPRLVAGLFASVDEMRGQVEALTEAQILRRKGNAVVVRYELDVRRLLGPDAGALVSKAPVSRYAITNHFETAANDAILVWWELEQTETARLNPRKGLLGGLVGNLGEPELVHGYLLVEPVPGTNDSVLTYANHVVPKSSMARAASGTINHTSRATLKAMVERVARWAEATGAADEATRKLYHTRLCELLLAKP